MNAIESWETEGGALRRYTHAGGAADNRAVPATWDVFDQEVQAPVAVSGALSSGRSETTKRESRYPKFRNDRAVPEIRIGVRKFNCIGVSPPHDHPHVYINMGHEDAILCPYCATPYRYDPRLAPFEVDPPDSLFVDPD